MSDQAMNNLSTDDWEKLLGEVKAATESDSNGDIVYLKAEKTRLRLVIPPDRTLRTFFAQVDKVYQGKAGIAFIIPAVIIQSSNKEDQNVDPDRVRYVRIAKTILPQIISQLTEGYDLFGLTSGHAITIEKTEAKKRTSYLVKTSPRPVPVNPTNWPESTMSEAAEAETKRQHARSEAQANEAAGGTQSTAGADFDE